MRVTTQGPIGRLGAAALPIPARMAQAYQSWGRINGSPGITRIPAPSPPVPQDSHRALHRSSDAPQAWYPAVYYYSRANGGRPPVSVSSDNQMPVPAVDPRGVPAYLLRGPTFLGQQPIPQPRAVPVFRGKRVKTRFRPR